MKKIQLNNNKFILIDDEDERLVQDYTWCVGSAREYQHVKTTIYSNKTKVTLYLHRLILNDFSKDKVIHFLDGNSLNLQKENLMLVTRSIKCHINNKNNISKKSLCRGVAKRSNAFTARISINGTCKYLGRFATEQEASYSYDTHALQIYGIHALVNFNY